MVATEVAEKRSFIIADVGRSKWLKCATIYGESVSVHFWLRLGMDSSYVSGSYLELYGEKILLNGNLHAVENVLDL